MRVAVVGSGISGLAAARALDRTHDVTLFEKDDRLGGHACTVDVNAYGKALSVDVGFIVFNPITYPNFSRLLEQLGVEARPTPMEFSVSLDDARFEWSPGNLSMMLAQRSNMFKPGFYRFLLEILRFFRTAKADVAADRIGDVTLKEYMARHRFSATLAHRMIIPMGASIWSASDGDFMAYPAEVLLKFMVDHRLLSTRQPVWLTIIGGSRTYVTALRDGLRATVRPRRAVVKVERVTDGVSLTDDLGDTATFDQVVLACHAPDALALLDQPSRDEREILGAFKYAKNQTVLHGDDAFMPRRRAAWSSWNYIGRTSDSDDDDPVALTYWMNRLQQIDDRYPLFVTLNPPHPPREGTVFASFDFEHPQFDRAAIDAQKKLASIQGLGGVWFCGAYTGYGFHEDGLRSGLEIAQKLGAETVEPLGHPRIFL